MIVFLAKLAGVDHVGSADTNCMFITNEHSPACNPPFPWRYSYSVAERGSSVLGYSRQKMSSVVICCLLVNLGWAM